MKTVLKPTIISLLLIVSIIAVILVSVDIRDDQILEYVWIEAEEADSVHPPIEIVEGEDDVSGGQFLQIERMRQRREILGLALFEFDIAVPGEYALWARVKWRDGCGNSFLISAGDKPVASHIGQDGIYNRWHWIRDAETYQFAKGINRIELRGSEDGVKMDKILLTNNLDFKPRGIDQGQIHSSFSFLASSNWEQNTPKRWIQRRDPITDQLVLDLIPSENRSEEYMVCSQTVPYDEFVIVARLRSTQENPERREYRILIDYQDEDNFYYANISFHYCRIAQRLDGSDEVLREASHSALLNDMHYHDFIVERKSNSIAVACDGKQLLSAHLKTESAKGRIGIGSTYGGFHLEQMQYIPSGDIYFASNFYVVDDQSTFRDDWHSLSGTWWRSGVVEAGFAYGARADSAAFSVSGEKTWSYYSLRAAAKSKMNAGVGICAYYHDRENYYLLRTAPGGSLKEYANKFQLIKIIDGNQLVLGEKEVSIRNDQWYELRMDIIEHKIQAFLDTEPILGVVDSSLSYGQIALYMDPSTIRGRKPAEISIMEGAAWDYVIFDVPAEPGSDGLGIAFLYRDDKNYHLFKWNTESFDSRISNKIQFIRWINGVKTILAEKDHYPYSIGKNYRIAIVAYKDKIQVSLEDTSVFDINYGSTEPGRIGLYNGRGPDNAYFDDVEVKSILSALNYRNSTNVSTEAHDNKLSYYYQFSRPASAGRDLCSWRIASGTWVISKFYAALVGQCEADQNALVWHKHPAGLPSDHSAHDLALSAQVHFRSRANPFFIICGSGFDETSGYKCICRASERGARFILQRNGKVIDTGVASVDASRDFIPIWFERCGPAVKLYVSKKDTPLIEFYDETPLEQNRIGIGVEGPLHHEVYFSEIRIEQSS